MWAAASDDPSSAVILTGFLSSGPRGVPPMWGVAPAPVPCRGDPQRGRHRPTPPKFSLFCRPLLLAPSRHGKTPAAKLRPLCQQLGSRSVTKVSTSARLCTKHFTRYWETSERIPKGCRISSGRQHVDPATRVRQIHWAQVLRFAPRPLYPHRPTGTHLEDSIVVAYEPWSRPPRSLSPSAS